MVGGNGLDGLDGARRLAELDLVDLLREAQRAERLVRRRGRRRQVDEEQRLAVARERRLEQEREPRVAVRDVAPLRVERGEDAGERGERLVDRLGLLEALALGVRPVEALGAGQVDEVQRAAEARAPLGVRAREVEREDLCANQSVSSGA